MQLSFFLFPYLKPLSPCHFHFFDCCFLIFLPRFIHTIHSLPVYLIQNGQIYFITVELLSLRTHYFSLPFSDYNPDLGRKVYFNTNYRRKVQKNISKFKDGHQMSVSHFFFCFHSNLAYFNFLIEIKKKKHFEIL